MTTIDTRADTTADSESSSAIVSFFACAASWVVTTDHKRIGRLYLGFGLLVLSAAAVLGLLLGLERADDASTIFDADALLQMFQSYRVALVFGAIMPLALGLSIAVAPLQLGARSIAFPRLALTGFYSWLGGLALTMAALGANGGIGGGDTDAVDLFLAGHGLMILGLLASAGSVATSVLTTRAPGMTMRRVPVFAWSALIGALSMLLVLPILFGVIVYLFLDHRYAQLNFGGSEGIAAWIGWTFSLPAVAAFSIPAAGIAAEMTPTAFKARQPMRGVMFAGIALIGVTALAAVTQRFIHDVTIDTSGQKFVEDAVPMLIFTGLPLLGALIVLGLSALAVKDGEGGRPRISAPFVFGFLGFGLVGVGLVGNLFQSITDLELAGTTMEEGATLFVVYGTALAVMGGIVFWAPKLWGRVLSDKQATPLALLGVLGAALAALPLFVSGFLDQGGGVPASDADVATLLAIDGVENGSLWVILAFVGQGVMALTVLAFIGLMLKTFTGDGEDADINPYGAYTIEWSAASPAPAHNFDEVPTVTSPSPLYEEAAERSAS